MPDIPGPDEIDFETSDTIMRLETFPARLGIVGGGYVGSELAHVFSAFGAEVVQVEDSDTLLGDQDSDIARHFTAAARDRWDVRLGFEMAKVSGQAGAPITMHLADGSTVEVDVLLLAIGREPNSDLLEPRFGQGHRRRPRTDRRRRIPAHHRSGGVGPRRRQQRATAQARRQIRTPG